MAVKTIAPVWLSGAYLLGFPWLYAGQRAFGHLETASTVLTLIGVLLIVGATLWRAMAFLGASGERRRIEFITLLCQLGGLLALLIFFFTTDTGSGLLGVSEEGRPKFTTALQVLWAIILGVSLLPLLFIEFSQGFGSERTSGDKAAVEAFRVREMAASGLTIGLALSFLMVTCNVASERNIRKEVTYFKTTSPGTAVVNTVLNGVDEQLTVLLFFPEINEVSDEVYAYFRELDGRTQGKLDIQRVDRLVNPKLAKEHKVSNDGTIVLVKKDGKSENIRVTTDIARARRSELRELDGKVNKALMKAIRRKKIAYMTVGHGELNDPQSAGPLGFNPGLKTTQLKKVLGALNYQVKNFDGLGKAVPDDADILMVLAPSSGLVEEELNAIDDYLARGGSALISLDPTRDFRLGMLQGRLGVKFDASPLTDEKEFMPRRRNRSDHRLILTNQFSSHASVTSLSRGSARSGILLVNSGSLDDADFTAGSAKPKRTYVIRSMTSTFRDLDNDFTFDKDEEKKNRYNVVASIENPNAKPEKPVEGAKPKGMRVVVAADGELFADAILLQVPKAGAFLADSIKWLGGEEQFQGTVEKEKDVKIEQTKSEEATSFWLSIVGMPLLILLIGLLNLMLRRRRRRRA